MFLFIEPFYGGSHKAFADGLISHSRHSFDLASLPARFWKWRMRGAALHFIDRIENLQKYDGIVVSDLLCLSDFKALTGPNCPPILVYFHENQFTYPLSKGETMDYQFGFTDITTALSADCLLFNSRFHRDQFLSKMSDFITRMPDYQPTWVIDTISEKAGVCYPGCNFEEKTSPSPEHSSAPPLVIWNHRWEHDKNPEVFFNALAAVEQKGIDFRLALLGERFSKWPQVFDAAAERFAGRIVQFGPEDSRTNYIEWLKRGTVVVSTSNQENFGFSIVEAARFGCIPLLPNRLSYPEILPGNFHDTCIYQSEEDLIAKLAEILKNPRAFDLPRLEISREMERFSWGNRIDEFDKHLIQLAGSNLYE